MAMGAYATDFVEKTWPLSYGHGKSNKYPYPSEGRFPDCQPGERIHLGSGEAKRG